MLFKKIVVTMRNYFYSFFILSILTSFSMSAQVSSTGLLECKTTIDGIEPEKITREQFLKAEKLKVDSEGIEIRSFKFSLYQKNADPFEISNDKNGNITNEMKEQIAKCNNGSKIFIEYIRCVDQKNTIYTLMPLSIKLH